MALLWIDGFDWVANATSQTVTTPLSLKYPLVNNNWTSRSPRISGSGGFSLQGNDGGSYMNTPAIASTSTIVFGFGYYKNTPASFHRLFYAYETASSSGQFCVTVSAAGFIEVRLNNDTIIVTGTTQLLYQTWYYLEFKITVHPSAGTIVTKVNGVTDINASSLNTRSQSTNNVNFFQLHMLSGSWYCDDFYILDTTGSVNNDFLGDVQVQALYPSGAGTTTNFTPSTGSNYQNVDDVPSDGDTTYNTGTTNGDTDTYAFGDISGSASVKGVEVNVVARKTTSGTRKFAVASRINGTTYLSSDVSALDSYVVSRKLYDQNPDTTADWLVADVNAAEFGIRITN